MPIRRLNIAALILILILSGCASAAVTPKTPPIATATLIPDANVYAIDPQQSSIKYLATGLLNAQFPGTFKVIGQSIDLIPARDGYRVYIDLSFDLKSATATDSFMRDTLLSSLEVDKYPTAALIVVSKDAVELPADTVTTIPFAGTYFLHGQQHPVEFPVTLTMTGDSLHIGEAVTFKLSDYSINVPGFVVDDQITFTADLIAKAVTQTF